MLNISKSLRWIREEKCGVSSVDEKRPHYLVYRECGTKILKLVYKPSNYISVVLIGQNKERILLTRVFQNNELGLKEAREYGKSVYRKLLSENISNEERLLKESLKW
jgi:hypothetical protein